MKSSKYESYAGVCSSVVEHVTDNDGVPGSIPGTRTTSSLLNRSYEVQAPLTALLS